MKKKNLIIILLLLLVAAFAIPSCVKELDDETYGKTVYYGKIVEGSSQKPLSNISIRVTDGNRNYPEETVTDQDGIFKLAVNLSKIDSSFYLSISKGQKLLSLKGFGSKDFDFGTIELSTLPSVTTHAIENISTSTASGGGKVLADGGYVVTARGVCWNTTGFPTINSSHTNDGSDLGAFTSALTNLEKEKTYYVRAYATNEKGTSYGEQVNFTTANGKATLTTTNISSITTSTAISGGNISNDGGASITKRGICWNTTGGPTISDSHTEDGNGIGAFTSQMTGLSPSTTYYVRAYATNSICTSYGEQKSFTTTNGLPSINTTAASNITSSSLVTGGQVISDNGYTVTERGVVYATTPYPTIANDKISSGAGTGYFSCSITGLNISNTTYYIRAYATNAQGTAYGAQITIQAGNPQGYPTTQYGGYTYVLAPDMGTAKWTDAKSLCENMTDVFGDWFLPTRDELVYFCERKDIDNLTGFYSANYWSASKSANGYGYYVCVNNYCTSNNTSSGYTYRVRCVRKF